MQASGEEDSTHVHVSALLERLRREAALRAFVLTAPTRALASLGVSMDDAELVQLLEEVEAMDQRPRVVTARDVMTADVISMSPEASTHAAAVVLADNRVSGLPVIAPDGRVEGVLSVYDLLSKSGETVREVMSRDVSTVLDTAPISVVRATLVSKHVRRLPVVDAAGRLVGIISFTDLVRELAYR